MNVLITLTLIAIALTPSALVPEQILTHFAQPQTSNSGQEPVPAPEYQAMPIPSATTETPPTIKAASWYAIDMATGQTLTQSHGDTQRPIASVSKLATALVIIRDHQEDEVITVPTLPTYQPEDEIIGLKAGEHVTVKDLLAALLINSGNDAADTLAIADSGSKEAFATKMNQVMAAWGIKNAHFSNPSGLSDTNNGASAHAVATMGALALRNTTVTKLVSTQTMTISTKEGRKMTLTATDKLLQNGSFSGIKTGYTVAAGECFVGLTSISGHRVITVVLGSQDRFGDTKALADWIQKNYTWQ